MRDPAWKEWYQARHERACMAHGDEFEKYVTRALDRFHPGFLNPAATGRLGDGGADGLADSGRVLYACYGQRAIHDAEKKLAEKIGSDFARASDQWPLFEEWRFVTNAGVGPLASAVIIEMQGEHRPDSGRPIVIEVWSPERLWREVVSKLSPEDLDSLFPGLPRASNVDLADLVPLLESLADQTEAASKYGEVRPVPFGKMKFNGIGAGAEIEFNEGRILSSRIDRWFDEASDPGLRDAASLKFRTIYDGHAAITDDPRERLERVYTSVGGSDFRLDSRRANAAYAITVYFFDSCEIFEEPPPGFDEELFDVIAN